MGFIFTKDASVWVVLVLAALVLLALFIEPYIIMQLFAENLFLNIIILVLLVYIVYLLGFKGEKKKPSASAFKMNVDSKLLMLIVAAVAGRLIIKAVQLPSVEPVIPLAVFASLTIGAIEGAAVGSIGYFASNIFLGGIINLWTPVQVLGGAIAGFIPAMQKMKPTPINLVTMTFVGTVIYEIIVNVALSGAYSMIDALPFTITHIASNLVIAVILCAFLPKSK